ncbi:MAG TPA: MarC family protein [Spirochaetia bacterium]|nr:MarC family protein [Spirochaetia bacterium]
MLKNILLALIPVFVAVDAIGVLPIFISLTAEIEKAEKKKIIIQSMLTAAGLAIGFVFLGKVLFNVLGIAMGDFMIAGGAVLFCIAIIDIIQPEKSRRLPGRELGIVPLGTPLIAGPAVLTTSLIIIEEYGLVPTLISVVANILFAGTVFSLSGLLIRILGEPGTKALSKVTSLFLAAIAVMMIRRGLALFLS